MEEKFGFYERNPMLSSKFKTIFEEFSFSIPKNIQQKTLQDSNRIVEEIKRSIE